MGSRRRFARPARVYARIGFREIGMAMIADPAGFSRLALASPA